MTNPYLTLDQQIVGDSYTNTAVLDNLTMLCDEFGSRFGGTEGERLSAEFIQEKMREYGLSNVHLEPIEYLGWTRGTAQFEIISPIQKTIPCISLPHSPPIDLEGEIIAMGSGAPADFETQAEAIQGKIVMTNSEINPKGLPRWVHRKEKYTHSVLAGAAGFIFVNHYPGYGPATGGIGHGGRAALIPGISITNEDGAFIERLILKHGTVQIRLTTTDQLAPMTSWNVVGEILGDEFPEEIVMLGSHYDGHDISQGAVDPASGVAAALEAARVLQKYAAPLPRTVRFVLWGVEEIGLLGSHAYVVKHADELKNLRFYLNLDAAGGDAPKDINLHEWPGLGDLFAQYQAEMALDFDIGQKFHTASDHFPFLLAGVATAGVEPVRVTRSGRGYGHTYYDTVDKVSLENLRKAATLAARIGLRVATEENWPVSRRTPEDLTELMNRPQYQETRELYKKLDELYENL
jgi:aminopeptidase YwaD